MEEGLRILVDHEPGELPKALLPQMESPTETTNRNHQLSINRIRVITMVRKSLESPMLNEQQSTRLAPNR